VDEPLPSTEALNAFLDQIRADFATQLRNRTGTTDADVQVNMRQVVTMVSNQMYAMDNKAQICYRDTPLTPGQIMCLCLLLRGLALLASDGDDETAFRKLSGTAIPRMPAPERWVVQLFLFAIFVTAVDEPGPKLEAKAMTMYTVDWLAQRTDPEPICGLVQLTAAVALGLKWTPADFGHIFEQPTELPQL
jgi:hypothetical protein